MYQWRKIHQAIPLAYVDNSGPANAVQTLNQRGVGKILGRIRSDGYLTPPEGERNAAGVALAVGCLPRLLNRASTVLDGGDIVMGATTAINTSSTMGMAGWALSNALILSVAVYLLWPTGKRLATAIHKRLRERYNRKSRPRVEARNG